ncbi:MAG: penicillin-insensitive murein endopeptidase [Pseudomonadota bacterium]
MRRIFLWTIVSFFGLSSALVAQDRQQARYLLGGHKTGSAQKPAVIGSTSRGCLAGGQELAENGPTWQAMRLSRNRNWGHPVLIDYVERVSAKVAARTNWKGLYIGDMNQPRGGPMISGHVSHQSGIDVDVWMLPPKRLNLTHAERESISSISIRSGDQRSVNSNWTRAHMEVMKIAASDPAVDRIFVTAAAKIYMCKNAKGDRKWLQKIRPFWGHHFHFHVRLKCPKGSKTCEKQTPTVAQLSKGGLGCDKTLEWWVTDALKPAKPDPNAPKPKPRKHPRQFTMDDLPRQCQKVLASN